MTKKNNQNNIVDFFDVPVDSMDLPDIQIKVNHPDADYLEAIEECSGDIFEVSRMLKVLPSTVYRRIKRSEMLRDAIRDEMPVLVDLAENVLLSKLFSGDLRAATFVLETLAKDRYSKAPKTVVVASETEPQPVGEPITFDEVDNA